MIIYFQFILIYNLTIFKLSNAMKNSEYGLAWVSVTQRPVPGRGNVTLRDPVPRFCSQKKEGKEDPHNRPSNPFLPRHDPLPSFTGFLISSTATLIATYINRLASASSLPGQFHRAKPKTYSRTSRLSERVGAWCAKDDVGGGGGLATLVLVLEEEEEWAGRKHSGLNSKGESYTSGSCE